MNAEQWSQWVTEELLNQRSAIVELGSQFALAWGQEGFLLWCDSHGWDVDIIKEPTPADVDDAIDRILSEEDTPDATEA